MENLSVGRHPDSLIAQMVLRIDRQYVPCFHFRVRQFTERPLPLAGRRQAGVIITEMRTGSRRRRERRAEKERQFAAKNLRHPPEGMPMKDLGQPHRWFVHLWDSSISTAVVQRRGRRLSE